MNIRGPYLHACAKLDSVRVSDRTNMQPNPYICIPGCTHACRDELDSGRVGYRLLLTYKYTAVEGGKYKPSLPLLNKWVVCAAVQGGEYNQRAVRVGGVLGGEAGRVGGGLVKC